MSDASSETEIGSPPRDPRWAMIADDLTGACDAGVQFAARGFSAVVRLASECQEAVSCDMLVATTHSRNDAVDVARAKIAAACHELINNGREIVYKKIDSTLRGNIAADIQTVMEMCGYSLGLIAPAFPAMGRRVIDGWLRVSGSSAGVHVPTLLREQGFAKVVHLDRTALNDFSALIERLKKCSDTEKTAVALDTATDDDLTLVARAGIKLRGRAFLGGSAGLAAATATVLAERSGKAPGHRSSSESAVRKDPPAVFILGSTHAVTSAQIEFLIRDRPVVIVDPNDSSFREMLTVAKQGSTLLVRFDPARDDSASVGEFLRALVKSPSCGVTLSGGDTAWAVCRILGAGGIKLEREILPGIPCGRLIGGLADGVTVVTKAGGFGSEDALAAIANFLAPRASTTL